MTRPLYAALSFLGHALDDPTNGRRQRDPLRAGDGLVGRTVLLEGGGRHGAVAGRTVFSPGLLPVEVEVFPTYGVTREQRDGSYRDNLGQLKALCQGTGTLSATYGDTQARQTQAVATVGGAGDEAGPSGEGRVHVVVLTLLDFWRGTDLVEIPATSLASPQNVTLTGLGGTAPITDLVIAATGPCSSTLEIIPRDMRVDAALDESLKYGVMLGSGDEVTIDCATGEITSADPDLVDYRKLTHPGNSAHLLEVPAGFGVAERAVRVLGGPAALTISGYPAWLSL